MLEQDETANRQASHRAAELIRDLCERRPLRILTHCNAGRLATVAWGTALGAVRALAEAGDVESVLADETRPLLQGARLTAYELAELGIPYRVCPDSAAAAAMSLGMVDVRDRRCRPDRALRRRREQGRHLLGRARGPRHGIPFIVVAPESTVDDTIASGADIHIEQRDPAEVTHFAGHLVTPAGADAFNPAFDVTPADLVTAIVTQDRVWRP